jgi:hypothetical protein
MFFICSNYKNLSVQQYDTTAWKYSHPWVRVMQALVNKSSIKDKEFLDQLSDY